MKNHTRITLLLLTFLFCKTISAQNDSIRSAWGGVTGQSAAANRFDLLIKSGAVPLVGQQLELTTVFLSCGFGNDPFGKAVVSAVKDSVVTLTILSRDTMAAKDITQEVFELSWKGSKGGEVKSSRSMYSFYREKHFREED